MGISNERLETQIHISKPKHKLGPISWGGNVTTPVVIEEYHRSVQIELRTVGKIFDRYSLGDIPARLLAVIERSDPDLIHLGITNSGATYNKLRSVRGFNIDTDPELSSMFRYIDKPDAPQALS
jgi:hypothetical protein